MPAAPAASLPAAPAVKIVVFVGVFNTKSIPFGCRPLSPARSRPPRLSKSLLCLRFVIRNRYLLDAARVRRAHRARADLDGEWALSGYPLTDGSFRIVANHDDEVLEVHVVERSQPPPPSP